MITQVGLQGLGTVRHQPSGGVALMNATCHWGQERRPVGTCAPAPAPAPSLEVGGLGVSAESLGAGFAAWGRVQVGWALLGQGLSLRGGCV